MITDEEFKKEMIEAMSIMRNLIKKQQEQIYNIDEILRTIAGLDEKGEIVGRKCGCTKTEGSTECTKEHSYCCCGGFKTCICKEVCGDECENK